MKALIALLLALAAAAPAATSDRIVERHLSDARALLERGRAKDAAAELEVARQLDPKHPGLEELSARLAGPQSPTAQALAASPTARAEECLRRAEEAYLRSDLAASREALEQALLLDAENARAKAALRRLDSESYKADKDAPFDSSVADLYEGGMREARKGRLVEARKKMEEALALNPAQAQVKAALARIQEGAQGQAGERQAEEWVREAGRLMEQKDWPGARKAIDAALAGAPEDGAARGLLERFRAAARPDLELHGAAAARSAKSGDWEKARASWRKALELEPGAPEAMSGLAKAEAALAEKKGEAARLKRADEAYNQGVDAFAAGDLGLAADRFKKALELRPGDAEAQKALDLVRQKLGSQVDKAAADAEALVQEAEGLKAKGLLPQALERCEAALAKKPGHGKALALRAALKTEMKGD